MKKNFEDFDKDDCKKVLISILNNKKHVDKKKTLQFLLKLQKIKNDNIKEIIKCSEEYFYFISSYFKLNDQEKTFFIVDQIKDFKSSKLQCCLNVLDPDNQKNIIEHVLSVDHFLCLYKYNYNYLNNISLISDYFIVTGHIKTNELYLIHQLLNKNKIFLKLVENENKKASR